MKLCGMLKKRSDRKNVELNNKFIDAHTGLEWVRVVDVDDENISKEFGEVRSWSADKNIQRFIAQKFSLDVVFKKFVTGSKSKNKDSHCDLYFCYENKKFVGVVFLSEPHGENDYSTIEYLFVNPNFYNKGVGTRMVASVSKNTEFFFGKDFGSGIMASVEESNTQSRSVFMKNKFDIIGHNCSDAGRVYSIFFKKLDDYNLNNDEKSL